MGIFSKLEFQYIYIKNIKQVIRRFLQIIFNIPHSNRFSTSYYLHKLKW